jgi:hypothetical protein
MKIRQFVVAILLAAGPMAAADAQSTVGPSVGADNRKESADVKAGSAPAAHSSNTPGATGKTVVPGSNSTVAGDKSATSETKTGSGGGGSK